MNDWFRIAVAVTSAWECSTCVGQDLLGATITRYHVGNSSQSIRLDIYVDSSAEVTRPYVQVWYGSGYTDLLPWGSTLLADGIRRVTYGDSVYMGAPGIYQVYVDLSFRVPEILNITYSDTAHLQLMTEFIYSVGLGWSGPDFTAPQLNVTQTETGALLAPSVFDPDGDSLQFSLVPCYGDGYYIPTGTTIDPNTGVITTNPSEPGKYAFCTKIEKIRQGVVLSTSYTDMTIQVDQVTSVHSVKPHALMGLFPQLITGSDNVTARCLGPSELLIHDILGRTQLRKRVMDGASIDLSRLLPGTYTYTLVSLDDNYAKSGKVVVY